MHRIIHGFFQAPFLWSLTLFSLLLVGGVVWSDWLGKRRNRRMLELVAASRKQQQRAQSPAGVTAASAPAATGRPMAGRWLLGSLAGALAVGVMALFFKTDKPGAVLARQDTSASGAATRDSAAGPRSAGSEKPSRATSTNEVAAAQPTAVGPTGKSSKAAPVPIIVSAPRRTGADLNSPRQLDWTVSSPAGSRQVLDLNQGGPGAVAH